MWRRLGAALVVTYLVAPAACFDFGALDEGGVDGGGLDAESESGPCRANQKVCLGQCYEQSDPSVGCSGECSACDTPANAQPGCALQSGAEVCSIGACNAQFGNCDNDPANGCETHTTIRSSCGACGNDCLQQFCELQAGSYICSPTCDAPNMECPGADGTPSECVDLQNDNANCGACGASCLVTNGAGTCNAGKCAIQCNEGYFSCGNDCILPTDERCGASCTACPSGKTCDTGVTSATYGTCVDTAGGATSCNADAGQCKNDAGVCQTFDFHSSPNCGGCGVDCKKSGKQCCTLAGVSSCRLPVGAPDGGGEAGVGGGSCKP